MSAPAFLAGPPVPDPVNESPPQDCFCDLILNGGVASGVVFPWAIVELARRFRFRCIGGNSVGAMAAALTAAAEYGRCNGNAMAFEVLRQAPLDLAKEKNKRTTMLSLFQPGKGLSRLFEILLLIFSEESPKPTMRQKVWRGLELYGLRSIALVGLAAMLLVVALIVAAQVPDLVRFLAAVCALGFALLVWHAWTPPESVPVPSKLSTGGADSTSGDWSRPVREIGLLLSFVPLVAMVYTGRESIVLDDLVVLGNLILALLLCGLAVLAVGLVAAWLALRRDLAALQANGYGICSGRAASARDDQPTAGQALIEWLHEGIQRSAGRNRYDPPLTFEDLWRAPRPGAAIDSGGAGADSRSISLDMFSTLVSLGRPVRWPLREDNQRLYFVESEWKHLFPPTLLNAVVAASKPYSPASDSDPEYPEGTKPSVPGPQYLEIPGGRLPIAVAARISLSFPILFSAVPVHAIDYEGRKANKNSCKRPSEKQVNLRRMRKCWMVDGGLCTNFPVHLFDAAHPRWPTFGLMLGRRIAPYKNQLVWLPDEHLHGRADNWLREVPDAGFDDQPLPGPATGLFGLLKGMLMTALDWDDNLTTRLPNVRNRVLRIALQKGEGQLNIAMQGHQILRMAHEYGTLGGITLVNQFAPTNGEATKAWREHLYVRALTHLNSLRRHLKGYKASTRTSVNSVPVADIFRDAERKAPLRGRKFDSRRAKLTNAQVRALNEAVAAVEALEAALLETGKDPGPYRPVPAPEIRQRSAI